MENVIKCPKCGREYLPCEIFLPDYFLGKSYTVSRDENGQIDYIDGSNMDLVEHYECDCGTKFAVKAAVSFVTEMLEEEEEGYLSEL